MTALHVRFAALACGLLLTALASLPATAQDAAATAAPATAPATEDARIAAFFEEVFQRSLKDNPMLSAWPFTAATKALSIRSIRRNSAWIAVRSRTPPAGVRRSAPFIPGTRARPVSARYDAFAAPGESSKADCSAFARSSATS